MDLPAQSGTQPPSAAVDVQAHSAGRQHGLGADKYRKTSSLAPRRKDQECRPRNDGEKRAPGKPYRQHILKEPGPFWSFGAPCLPHPIRSHPDWRGFQPLQPRICRPERSRGICPFSFFQLPDYQIIQLPNLQRGYPPIGPHSSQFGVDFEVHP